MADSKPFVEAMNDIWHEMTAWVTDNKIAQSISTEVLEQRSPQSGGIMLCCRVQSDVFTKQIHNYYY